MQGPILTYVSTLTEQSELSTELPSTADGRTRNWNVEVPVELAIRVRAKAATEDRTVRELLIEAVEAYLETAAAEVRS